MKYSRNVPEGFLSLSLLLVFGFQKTLGEVPRGTDHPSKDVCPVKTLFNEEYALKGY